MSAGGESARCYPCHMGNHTGSNGTAGCTGQDCGCKCRKPASVTFHGVTVTAKPGDAAWTPELGWHNAPEEVTGGGVTDKAPYSY